MYGKWPPLVMIEWEDSAQAAPQWQWLSEVKPPPVINCRSVGFLVRDNEREKALAISLGGSADAAQVSGVITIPTKAVLSMTGLTSSSRRRSCQGAASARKRRAT